MIPGIDLIFATALLGQAAKPTFERSSKQLKVHFGFNARGATRKAIKMIPGLTV